ncbi:MAG TPA: hypothetical protein VNE38_09035 [Ktedonobacteraceae bacterium]|nr:hypothetical protein [Ktedonobacteraceae bacterium]
MNNPQFLALFSAVFLALAGYNLFTGYKRIRDARIHGVKIKWFKQINMLTGTEYLLLALVFLLSITYRNNAIPANIRGIVLPLYLFFLLAAAVLAGLVIRQGILNARMLRAQARNAPPAAKSNGSGAIRAQAYESSESEEGQQRVPSIDRRRERRRNAAASRRRRAGKA